MKAWKPTIYITRDVSKQRKYSRHGTETRKLLEAKHTERAFWVATGRSFQRHWARGY